MTNDFLSLTVWLHGGVSRALCDRRLSLAPEAKFAVQLSMRHWVIQPT